MVESPLRPNERALDGVRREIAARRRLQDADVLAHHLLQPGLAALFSSPEHSEAAAVHARRRGDRQPAGSAIEDIRISVKGPSCAFRRAETDPAIRRARPRIADRVDP